MAENGDGRAPPRVSGSGAHSAGPGGPLPLQQGQCREAKQKEVKG